MRANVVAVLILLSVDVASTSVIAAPTWQLTTALSTISAIEKRSGVSRPLNLLEDMFDKESGLCSEGVWHNSWLGVSRVLAARQLRSVDEPKAELLLASARTLGDSLFRTSFDGTGFERRVSSGIWQSADEAAEALAAAGENAAFYQPSPSHRCASSAAACILFSMLAEEDMRERGLTELTAEEGESAASRFIVVADAFVDEFFDTKACKFRRAAPTPEGGGYFRAVDQAMGCLVCLRLARQGHQVASSRAMASCAADSLLREFGYALYATEGQPPGIYLGRVGGRNSWHDALASFALLASGCLGVGGETPAGLVRALSESYRMDTGVIAHVPAELRAAGDGGEPVAFSSTQAIWSAVVRAADLSSAKADALGGADVPALRAFFDGAVHDDGLLPVGNVYPEGRLWANTEFAAFVLLDRADFGPAPGMRP